VPPIIVSLPVPPRITTGRLAADPSHTLLTTGAPGSPSADGETSRARSTPVQLSFPTPVPLIPPAVMKMLGASVLAATTSMDPLPRARVSVNGLVQTVSFPVLPFTVTGHGAFVRSSVGSPSGGLNVAASKPEWGMGALYVSMLEGPTTTPSD
jgi:hypothetical protein